MNTIDENGDKETYKLAFNYLSEFKKMLQNLVVNKKDPYDDAAFYKNILRSPKSPNQEHTKFVEMVRLSTKLLVTQRPLEIGEIRRIDTYLLCD